MPWSYNPFTGTLDQGGGSGWSFNPFTGTLDFQATMDGWRFNPFTGTLDKLLAGVSPVAFQNFLTNQTAPSWLDNSGTTGNRMVYDSTGKLTWAPNNLLLNSATLSTQTITVTTGATNILSFYGTGSVTLSGGATGTLSGIGVNDRVSLVVTPTTTSLTLTVSGSVTQAQFERVTYQTTPRPWLPTGAAAVYGLRFDYDPATLAARGLLIEESRTNAALYSNDFTNAVWVKSNTTDITAALDQTGIDGVANSASSLLCNVANGTVLQSITLASSARAQSAIIKRLVGSGTISMTMDGGTTWRDITSQISSSWATAAIASQTLANPQVGFRMATAGDKIAVQYFQNENGAFSTSTIPTEAAAVTRAADIVKLSGAALTAAGAATGSAVVQTTLVADFSATRYFLASSLSRRIAYTTSATTIQSFDGTAATFSSLGSGNFTSGPVRFSVGWSPSGVSIVANNGTIGSGATNLSTGSNVYLGGYGTTQGAMWIAQASFYNQRLPDATLKSKSVVGGAL